MDMGINRPTKTRSNQPKKRTGFRGHLDDMSTFLFLGVTPLCQKVWNHNKGFRCDALQTEDTLVCL